MEEWGSDSLTKILLLKIKKNSNQEFKQNKKAEREMLEKWIIKILWRIKVVLLWELNSKLCSLNFW
jgi:hypothetical protein